MAPALRISRWPAAGTAAFNDAGGGPMPQARGNLAFLEAHGVCAFGQSPDGTDRRRSSTLDTGVVSAVNRLAKQRGIVAGQTCRVTLQRFEQ